MFFFINILSITYYYLSNNNIFRIIKNKEDKKRFIEKFSFFQKKELKEINLVSWSKCW